MTDPNQIAKLEPGFTGTDSRQSQPAATKTTSSAVVATGSSSAASGANSRSKSLDSRPSVPDSKVRIPSLSPQQLQFLLRVIPLALESERTYRVPACVTVAQSILESAGSAGWGSSLLFRLANNPFGIKYEHFPASAQVIGPVDRPDGTGRVAPSDYGHFDAKTWEIVNGHKTEMLAKFQRFPNLAEAFRCHALLLARSPRYRPAMKTVIGGPGISSAKEQQGAPTDAWKQFAERLGPKTSPLDSEHCGYSTNPSYSAELIKLVEIYRLNDPRTIQFYATGRVDAAEGDAEHGGAPAATTS